MRQRILLALLVSIAACSYFSSTPPLRRELENSGPFALSSENKFIAANLFLSKEMESSKTLKGFIEQQGMPDALELKNGWFSGYTLLLFYNHRKQLFTGHAVENDWVITGPAPIPLEEEITRKDDTPSSPASNSPVVDTKSLAPPLVKMSTTESILDAPPRNGLPLPKASITPIGPTTEKTARDNPPLREVTPAATPKPEETPLPADVLHEVKYKGETLRIVSVWYTGDRANANRIARINGLKNADSLYIGQKIRIPRYLLINSEPLSEADLSRLRDAVKLPQLP